MAPPCTSGSPPTNRRLSHLPGIRVKGLAQAGYSGCNSHARHIRHITPCPWPGLRWRPQSRDIPVSASPGSCHTGRERHACPARHTLFESSLAEGLHACSEVPAEKAQPRVGPERPVCAVSGRGAAGHGHSEPVSLNHLCFGFLYPRCSGLLPLRPLCRVRGRCQCPDLSAGPRTLWSVGGGGTREPWVRESAAFCGPAAAGSTCGFSGRTAPAPGEKHSATGHTGAFQSPREELMNRQLYEASSWCLGTNTLAHALNQHATHRPPL